MMSWSDGEYERTAATLEPASEALVASLGDLAGRRLLDLGCGTGNAALAAARRHADVVAIDPAERLVGVARARAAAEGLRLDARVGEAGAIPLEDGSVDVVVSVFAVIFAPDHDVAAREMMRVVKDDGCVVLTTWTDEGPIAAAGSILRASMGPRQGDVPRWGDRAWLEALFARHGGRVEVAERTLPFEAPSAKAWLDQQVEVHPAWRAVRRAHEGREEAWARIYDGMLAALREGTTDDPWRVTSRYLVVTVRRV